MIVLTPAQANRVRGLSVLGSALVPFPLANGNYVLPETVLTDPAHERLWPALNALPKVPDESVRAGVPQNPNDPLSPVINSDYEQDPVKRGRAAFRPDWKPGETVVIT